MGASRAVDALVPGRRLNGKTIKKVTRPCLTCDAVFDSPMVWSRVHKRWTVPFRTCFVCRAPKRVKGRRWEAK